MTHLPLPLEESLQAYLNFYMAHIVCMAETILCIVLCVFVYSCVDIIISLKSGDSPGDSNTTAVNVDTSLNSLNSLNPTPNNLSTLCTVVPSATLDRYSEPSIFNKLSPGQFGPKGIIYICLFVKELFTYIIVLIIVL